MANINPEQSARENIDEQLVACGWIVQDYKAINRGAGLGVAVRENPTNDGFADYMLYVQGEAVGVIEAKREEEGQSLTVHEGQAERYSLSKVKYLDNVPLRFLYLSTGKITRFADNNDPKPRYREVFTFHQPETLLEWLNSDTTLRRNLVDNIPILEREGLRDCQITAISNLDVSFKENKPRALIQMATGSGKTFTAITAIYRLLKFAKAKRILFLVDTRNLGEQAEQEFNAFIPNDDNKKFVELYSVNRLQSSHVDNGHNVYICTIQRLYSILKGEELNEGAETENPSEFSWEKKPAVPVAYNSKLPIEFFDFIVIDECHRSIYNIWMQVLDYFDSFLIGLTATPDNRTFGFFQSNVVSEYTHEQAIADGVNVGFNVFLIETEIGRNGSVIWKGQNVDTREKLTKAKRWTLLDEDVSYTKSNLDDKVVSPPQIRLVLETFKNNLPVMFQDRLDENGVFEVPKTLIFAKTDSHADDIVMLVREIFGEGNDFCKKITHKTEDPKGTLAKFRNDYYPRIAVTVDMIATGTDVKPLECLIFMRDVKSRNYFEQMKGRGTRVIDLDGLRKVTPTAKYAKDHFVIVDAIGVTKSLKTDSRPLDKKPSESLKNLLQAMAVGAKSEELFTTVASRLSRLDRQLTEKEKLGFTERAYGKDIPTIVNGLLNAYNPDTLDEIRLTVQKEFATETVEAKEKIIDQRVAVLQNAAAAVFTGELNTFIEEVRTLHYQILDNINQDKVINVGWKEDSEEEAKKLIADFAAWTSSHKDDIIALTMFYDQPYRRRDITYTMIADLLEKLKTEKPNLAPLRIWHAYEKLGQTKDSIRTELVALVSLVRAVIGIDENPTDYTKTIDRNFQNWVFRKQAGAAPKFTEDQMNWLRMIKDHIATSFHIDQDDFDMNPFVQNGGLLGFYRLFGSETNNLINELNEALVA